jgi:hypothetical protein
LVYIAWSSLSGLSFLYFFFVCQIFLSISFIIISFFLSKVGSILALLAFRVFTTSTDKNNASFHAALISRPYTRIRILLSLKFDVAWTSHTDCFFRLNLAFFLLFFSFVFCSID